MYYFRGMKTISHPLFSGIWLLVLFWLISGCSASLKTTSLIDQSNAAYETGNYTEALSGYEKLIAIWDSENPRNQNPYLDRAGHAAFWLSEYEKAINYFTESTHYKTASLETYTHLIEYHRERGNFSREMMALEGLVENYPDASATKKLRSRLFEMAVESGQWQLAEEQWDHITDASDLALMEKYFEVNRRLENRQLTDSLANVILTRDKDNLPALEWEAKKFFDRAEERYNTEMEAYERNKTRRQYARLVDELELAGKDFRKARDIYERLYRLNPEKRYAMQLFNIYSRFEDHEKAAFYRARMK
jgi:tetratricopeptide (TPR) repeat protein